MTNNTQSLKTSRDSANTKSNSTIAGSASKSCNEHFVEVELVGEDDKGVAGIEYLLTLPDGSEIKGFTNANGLIRINGTDPGNCEITFQNLDKDTWESIK